MAHHLWVRAVTDQISFDHQVWQTRHDTMRRERNGCYSSSNNPNGISKQVRSIQNGNEIVLNISPTCLNWKKMEGLLTVIWRYMQSTLRI